MEPTVAKHKLILLQLERSRLCFIVATRRADSSLGVKPTATLSAPGGPSAQARQCGQLTDLHACVLAAGLETIRAQLRRARQAADIAASADSASLTNAAAEAVEALNFVAAAVITPGRPLLLSAEALEAASVVTQLAQAMARHQEHQFFMASDAASRASAAGNPAAATSAALEAQEAAALALWAARVGGLQLIRKTESFPQNAAEQEVLAAAAEQRAVADAYLAKGPSHIAVVNPVAAADVDWPPRLEQPQKRVRLQI